MESEATTSDPVWTLVEMCKNLRQTFDYGEKEVRRLMNHGDFNAAANEGQNYGEAKANIMLAFRAMEDCRMRLGKVIQHMTTGVSIYDAAQQPDPMPPETAQSKAA